MLWKRLTSRHAIDIAYAGVFFLVFLGPALAEQAGSASPFVLAGFAVALAIRRRSPRWSLGSAWVLAIVQMAGSVVFLPGNVAIFAILYCSAAYGDRILRWVGLASAILGGVVAATYLTLVGGQSLVSTGDPQDAGFGQFVTILVALWAVLGLSWALGRLSYARRSSTESKHAAELASVEQARAQNDIAIEQERNRIARDMHDIVAHSLAVVIAQADGARYVRTVDPEAVDEALTTISSTAREALGDVRVLLGQLRHSQDDLPTPALTDLHRLFDQMRAAGLRIDDTLADEPLHIGTAAQLALYRIAQESLTNALRHGDASRPVTVYLGTDSGGFELIVRSALGSPTVPDGHLGHGVVGMRERAALSGGLCTAGVDDGSWTVRVWIPASTTKAT